jgi:hypothetical protein
MQFAVVQPADRDGVLVAHLAAERARLGEADMMRFGRRSAADDTGLGHDESAMLLVAQANGLWLDALTVSNRMQG